MWFQLTRALDGNLRLRRCPICGQWEDMEKGKHRESWTKHKQCANNEAVKRYRSKQSIGEGKA
jgi:translation initiation factor 2 beta subunit (eIF-2beta)/eIF-5